MKTILIRTWHGQPFLGIAITMKQLQPIVWEKGIVLTPQHLQTQDRFSESLLKFHLDALSFRPWGFTTLEIDRDSLASGSFALSEVAGIFADGMPFDIPKSDPLPLSIPLAPCFLDGSKSVAVYLTAPPFQDYQPNTAFGPERTNTRFLATYQNVRDQNSLDSEEPILVARKNLRLEPAPLGGLSGSMLAAARVSQEGPGKFKLDPNFVPPLLDMSASSVLLGILHGLVEIMSAKSSELTGKRHQTNLTLSDIVNFWLLYGVNSHLPLFRHILETRKRHPEALFCAMTSLAGALSSFSPPALPPYNHDEPGPVFAKLQQIIRDLLKGGGSTAFFSFPFKPLSHAVYSTAEIDDKYFDAKLYKHYLSIGSTLSEAELLTRVPSIVKIASENRIGQILGGATKGIPLFQDHPRTIPTKPGHAYFSVDQSDPEWGAWKAAKRPRKLAALIPDAIPRPDLEFIVVTLETSQS
jgi:type VI secretion system protein ImpJ